MNEWIYCWTQVSEQSKMNVIDQPAGKLEEFVVAALIEEPSREEIARLFLENEMKVVVPPLKVDWRIKKFEDFAIGYSLGKPERWQ